MSNKNRPMLQLSSENMSPEEQFESMRASICPVTDIQLDDNTEIEQFKAESSWYSLGNIAICQSSYSPVRYHRNKKKIAQNDDLEDYIFHISSKGNYIGVSGQREIISGTGSISVMDTRNEIYGQSTDCSLLTTVIPCNLLKNADQLHCMSMAANHVKTRVLREHMLTLWDTLPDIDVSENSVFSQATVALINALFSSDKHLQQDDVLTLESSFLTSVKSSIEKNLSCVQLGIVSLCQEFFCSRATLCRLFKPYGGVAHYIRERRLLAAFKVLSNSRMTRQRIIDVAIQHGFSNQSIFSRLFRQQFGVKPSEVTMLGIALPQPDRQSTQVSQTAQHIASWLNSL